MHIQVGLRSFLEWFTLIYDLLGIVYNFHLMVATTLLFWADIQLFSAAYKILFCRIYLQQNISIAISYYYHQVPINLLSTSTNTTNICRSKNIKAKSVDDNHGQQNSTVWPKSLSIS